jgi:hypothetical protein
MDDEETFGSEHGPVLASLRGRRGECPAVERLVALAHGDVTAEERALLEAHAALCAACTREIELVIAGPADVDDGAWERIARGLDRRPAPWRSVPARVARSRRLAWMGAAAGVVLAVGLAWRYAGSPEHALPSSTTRGSGIRVVQPAGSVPRVDLFEWSAPPVRATFRVEVRRESETIWQGVAERSPLVAPDDLRSRLQPSTRYSWRVVATGADQKAFLESDWTSFRLVP